MLFILRTGKMLWILQLPIAHCRQTRNPHSAFLTIVYATNCLEHILTLSCLHRSNLFKIYVIQQVSKHKNRFPTKSTTWGDKSLSFTAWAPNKIEQHHRTHIQHNTETRKQEQRRTAAVDLDVFCRSIWQMETKCSGVLCPCLLVNRFNLALIMKYSGLVARLQCAYSVIRFGMCLRASVCRSVALSNLLQIDAMWLLKVTCHSCYRHPTDNTNTHGPSEQEAQVSIKLQIPCRTAECV